jgi:cyclic pyranopterin phosphate synthase
VTPLVDGFSRTIDYLRVSVTDRCNLRCVYCMPATGVRPMAPSSILSYEEIGRIVRIFSGLGVRFVRLTGGEPLVRRDLTSLIRDLRSIPAIESLTVTTNGILLAETAASLRDAGLTRVNVSLDTLREERYKEITRGGELAQVLAGLSAAQEAGLSPVKINCVVIRGFNDDEIESLASLTLSHPYSVRFIEYMPLGARDYWAPERCVPTSEIRARVEALGTLTPVEKPTTAGPAEKFRLPGAAGQIGFISPVSNHFCGACNRVRLTSEGLLRLCLFSLEGVDLRTPLREGATDDQLERIIRESLARKPDRSQMGSIDDDLKAMYRIGG